MGDVYIAGTPHRCLVQCSGGSALTRPAGSIWQCGECGRLWYATVWGISQGEPWKPVRWYHFAQKRIIRQMTKSVQVDE